jgi:hypothetical protein
MKKVMLNTKIGAMVLAALFSTGVTTQVLANDKHDQPAELKYVGDVNERPVYRLALKNDANTVYFVSVRDGDGSVLYREKLQGTNIVRNYQFADMPLEAYNLTFEVSNAKGSVVDVYSISKSKKIFDQVDVTKVK